MRREYKFPKIQVRLIVGLTILVFCIAAINITHYFDVKKMNKINKQTVAHPYIVSTNLRDIEIHTYAIHRTMKDVVLATNESELNAAIAKVDEHEKLIIQKIETVEEYFLGKEELVNDLKLTYFNWKQIRNTIIDCMKNEEKDKAAEITKTKGVFDIEQFLSKIHKMIAFADSEAKLFNSNSNSIMRQTIIESYVLFIFTTLIGVFIFIWLYRSISLPINNLINRIKNTSAPQLINKLPAFERNKLVILNVAISELENREKTLKNNIEKQAHELDEAQNLLEKAIDNASIGMLMTDIHGKLTNVNKAFCKFIGYSEEELLKMTVDDFTHKADKAISSAFINKIASGESETQTLEKAYIRKTGELVYGSVYASLVKDNRDNPICIFAQITDLTKQQKYEEEKAKHKKDLEDTIQNRTNELNNKAEKLERSQKALTFLLEDVNDMRKQLEISNLKLTEVNEELEAFSYSISHDLKTPLRAIDGFSKILIEDHKKSLNDEGVRVLNIIISNANKMRHLIDDILKISRLGRKIVTKNSIDLNTVINDIILDAEPIIANRDIEWKLANFPIISGDRVLINQLFANLISNAIKFTNKKEKAKIEIGYTPENNKNTFFVKDNGVGFNMKYSKKAFEVFQRLHSSDEFEGTGIGLAIVKRIVRKHSGTIWVESEINKGTIIYFQI